MAQTASFPLPAPALFCPGCRRYLGRQSPCPCGQPHPHPLPTPGKPLWQQAPGGPLRGAPLLAGDVLYVLSKDGFLHALTLAGDVRWSQPLGGAGQRSPVLAVGYVIAGTRDGELVAYHAKDGAAVWRYATNAPGVSALTVASDVIYTGDGEGSLHAVDAASGQLVWRSATTMHISAAPLYWRAQVFAGNHAGGLYAFDARQGRQSIWARDVCKGEQPRIKALAGSGGALFVGLEDGRVLKFNSQRGHPEKAWRFKPAGTQLSALVWDATAQHLYVGTDAGLAAVDAQTGGTRWTFKDGGRVVAAPVMAAELCFVACEDALYVLEAGSGALAWQIPFNEPTAGLAFGAGALYVAGRAGTLAAWPWHGGQWRWAAEFCTRQGAPEHAAAFSALAGDSAPVEERAGHYAKALAVWRVSDNPERAPRLMDAAPYLYSAEERAGAYCQAAKMLAAQDRLQAAKLYQQAADIYDEMEQAEPAQECRDLASHLAALPRLRVNLVNAPPREAREKSQIVFEIRNYGAAPTQGPVGVRMGGQLAKWFRFELAPLPAKARQEVVAEDVISLGPQLLVDLFYAGPEGIPLNESKTFPLDVKYVDPDILAEKDLVLMLELEEGAPLPKVRADSAYIKVRWIPKTETMTTTGGFQWPEMPPGLLSDERELATPLEVEEALEVGVGYSAIMLADGASLGCSGPGRYTRADFPELRKPLLLGRAPRWQAVLVLLTPFRLGFRCGPYLTADGAQIGVALAVDVSIQPERDLTFWRGSGVPSAPLTTLDLAARLEPTVANVIESWLREQSTVALSPNFDTRGYLTLMLEEELRGQWQRIGVYLEEVTAIQVV